MNVVGAIVPIFMGCNYIKAIIADDGTILGAVLFCAESPEIINLIKLAMDHQLKAEVIRDFIFTHPTISEGLNDLFSI